MTLPPKLSEADPSAPEARHQKRENPDRILSFFGESYGKRSPGFLTRGCALLFYAFFFARFFFAQTLRYIA